MRKQVSHEIVRLYEADSKDFLDRLVTHNETLVPHFDPESKAKSGLWRHSDSPAPKMTISKKVQ